MEGESLEEQGNLYVVLPGALKDLVQNDMKNNLRLLNLLDPDKWSVFPSYLSSKRRKLTYEKIPGVESGQTKLVFKYDK